VRCFGYSLLVRWRLLSAQVLSELIWKQKGKGSFEVIKCFISMGGICSSEDDIEGDDELSLRQFQLLRSVGRGAFGKVRIVQKRDDKKLYALKYINKEKCIKMKAVQNVIQERQLLEQIKHPLIVNLQFAFQDDENMFMVLDLMLGGDLRYRLDRNGPIPEEQVKFYTAEIALGLAYLHKERIVHRDIKPDNLLLDEHGHVHLTDFNVAIRVKPEKMLTAAAGTRAYMAPEILKQKLEPKETRTGYFTTVDWWSLGIVMYECLYGKRPFQGKNSDELSTAILNDDLKFPMNERISPQCVDCVRLFLERDITKRLGCGPDGLEDIKKHPFFSDIDWEKLIRKEVQPPFVPDSNKVNFDATFELEEMLLEDNPLKARPRKKRKPKGNKENEQQFIEMEQKFQTYSTLTRKQKEQSPLASGDSKSKASMPPSEIGDQVERGREESVHSMNYFPNEKDLNSKKEKEKEHEDMEEAPRASMDVVEEEDNIRED